MIGAAIKKGTAGRPRASTSVVLPAAGLPVTMKNRGNIRRFVCGEDSIVRTEQ